MKLYYYRLPKNKINFGDNLNPWLWKQLLGDFLDEDQSTVFIGMGTLLNGSLSKRTDNAQHRVIFGSGAGYGKGQFTLDSSYKVYCVRGFLSAQLLGISEEFAVTDPGILVRKIFQPKQAKTYKFAYMPHHELAGSGWEIVCKNLGFAYINPGWPIEDVLETLGSTEVLLAEAMHGAIIADAFRIPWIPIVTHHSILRFKWQDWCSSIRLEYQPVYLDRLHHPRDKKNIFSPARLARDWFRQKVAGEQLLKAAKNSSPLLSTVPSR